MMGLGQSFETTLLAKITDELSISNWIKTGAKKDNKPNFILPKLLNIKEEKIDKEVVGFSTIEQYERAKRAITGGEA